MREVEPHEMSRGLGGIAHEMMVIGPNEGDKQIAHRITEPCWPERQQRFEGRKLRGTQIKTSTVMRTAKTPSENALSRSVVLLACDTAVALCSMMRRSVDAHQCSEIFI